MIHHTLAIAQTDNAKLGPGWGCTYRPVGLTCPSTCPLLGAGCYAESGRVAIHSRRSTDHVAHLGHLDGVPRVRWEVSGDALLPSGRLDRTYFRAKIDWHKRNPGSISLGYTHAPAEWERARCGPAHWPRGFHTLASVHTLAEAKKWQARGWKTARVVPDAAAPIEADEAYCPYDLAKHRGRKPTVNCATCQLCFSSAKNIVFIQF